MDKRVIFAVAGSGKTTYLIDVLNLVDKFLLITYTNANVNNLRVEIIRKFGYFPSNIKLLSYYTFLYNFCFKPFLKDKCGTKGINYRQISNRYSSINNREHYIDNFDRIYSSRISKLILNSNENLNVTKRIEKYFDYLLIDEIQDFGANDFNLLKEICKADVKIILVGDFFQHTYDTSRDGNVNSNLHNSFPEYIIQFEKMGLHIDTTSLSKSYRCSPTVCKYITDNLGIVIESHKIESTIIKFIETVDEAKILFSNPEIIKLFFKEHYKYNCYSKNWGESKGENKYYDICVILNKKTFEKYQERKLHELPKTTKNKLYVALSRAKNNVYLLPDNLIQ